MELIFLILVFLTALTWNLDFDWTTPVFGFLAAYWAFGIVSKALWF